MFLDIRDIARLNLSISVHIYFILFTLLYTKPTHKKVYTMDIKMAQRVLLAHRQLQGRATDAAP